MTIPLEMSLHTWEYIPANMKRDAGFDFLACFCIYTGFGGVLFRVLCIVDDGWVNLLQ